MTPREPWVFTVGYLPNKVTAREEPTRGDVVYLWWRAGGNWKKKSLRRGVRTARGALDSELVKFAKCEAEAAYARLVAGVGPDERAPQHRLTLGETRALLVDPQRGQYPANTPHRREAFRALEQAVRALGAGAEWDALKPVDLTALWRDRIRALAKSPRAGQGVRGAEITVTRILAIAAWLREQQHVGPGACQPPTQWRNKLRDDWRALRNSPSDPTINRPRHTLEEMRAIMAKAAEVDPRLELLLALGAEIRLGQVARARRTDLDLEHASFTVRSSRHKRGTVELLTAGQMRVVRHALTDGYLRDLERQTADYPLFPGGQLAGSRPEQWRMSEGVARATRGPTTPTATAKHHLTAAPIDRSTIIDWFKAAETLAGVAHVRGRAAYGVKRVAVDAAKAEGISREGLMAHGGWTDTTMPDTIYADAEQGYAREEARRVRARIRGEDDTQESEPRKEPNT